MLLPGLAAAQVFAPQPLQSYNASYAFFIGDNATGTERLSIIPSGNIGISVPAPTTRLEVAGTVSATILSSSRFNLSLTQVTTNCGSIALGAVCTASCTGAQKVLTGGCTTGGGALTSSRPLADSSGWSCVHGAILGNTVTAVATCANIQ